MDELHGIRLWISIALLFTCLLLSSLESTIVSTILISISDDFHNYNQSSWVVIAYLLTYSSFLIVYARLSDITGRKPALLTGVAFFTIASLACGLARSLTQLIVFRALQGIGGAGIFSLTMVVVMEVTPKRHIGLVSGAINLVFVVASAIGPVMGGAIASRSTWRWCFYLNVPPGGLAFILMWILFPHLSPNESEEKPSIYEGLRKVDWAGLFLLPASTILLIIPLEEAENPTPWGSPLIIATFATSGVSWSVFAAWELYLAYRPGEHLLLPMLPLRVVFHRIIGSCLLISMVTGIAFTSSVVYLPQRFQLVNDLDPIEAGMKILPLLLVSAFGSMAGSIIMSKSNLGSWITLFGNMLQVIGLGLSSIVPATLGVPASGYGYQAILGLGLGTSLSGSFLLARFEARKVDTASVVGAITQIRLFGGVLGIAICRVCQKVYLSSRLVQVVPPATAALVQSSTSHISSLPPQQALAVRKVYGQAYNFMWRILMYISLSNLAFALMSFQWRKKSIDGAEGQSEEEARQEHIPAGAGPGGASDG